MRRLTLSLTSILVVTLALWTISCADGGSTQTTSTASPSPTQPAAFFPEVALESGEDRQVGVLGGRHVPNRGTIEGGGFVPLMPMDVARDSVISIVISSDIPTATMVNNVWRVEPSSEAERLDDKVRFDSREFVSSDELVPSSVVSLSVEVVEGRYEFLVSGIWSDGRQASWAFHVSVVGKSP